MVEQIVAVPLEEAGPIVVAGNLAGLVVRRLRPLVSHLEEEQVRQLFDVIAIAHPVIAEDVAVVPELLDDRGCIHYDVPLFIFRFLYSASDQS